MCNQRKVYIHRKYDRAFIALASEVRENELRGPVTDKDVKRATGYLTQMGYEVEEHWL